MKTVGSFVAGAKKELKALYDAAEADAVLVLLLEDVLQISRTELQRAGETALSQDHWERLNRYVAQLKQNIPVQYVLGSAWFGGMRLKVNEHVLIPRPETEELCEWLLSHVASISSRPSILDIGTGSGCIAIALKRRLPGSEMHAFDISEEALAIAKQNAANQGADIHFYIGDILSDEFQRSFNKKLDVIISNPPYVRRSEMPTMAERVKSYEPHQALFVEDEDALIFYRVIAGFAKMHLKPGGQLFFEINESLGAEVKKLLEQNGFGSITLRKDLSGKERMICSSTPSNHK